MAYREKYTSYVPIMPTLMCVSVSLPPYLYNPVISEMSWDTIFYSFFLIKLTLT